MNEKALNTGLSILSAVIMILGLVFGLIIMSGNNVVIDSALYLSYVVLIASVAIAIIFGLIYFLSNIKGNMSLLIGLVALVVIGIISYSMGSSEVKPDYVPGITPNESKLSEAGIIFTYFLLIGAVVAAIWGEVVRLFK